MKTFQFSDAQGPLVPWLVDVTVKINEEHPASKNPALEATIRNTLRLVTAALVMYPSDTYTHMISLLEMLKERMEDSLNRQETDELQAEIPFSEAVFD